jgi:hypothetical protein
MLLKLYTKGVWYVIKLDKIVYTIGVISKTPIIPDILIKGEGKNKVNEVIEGMVKLKLEKDSEKLGEKLV